MAPERNEVHPNPSPSLEDYKIRPHKLGTTYSDFLDWEKTFDKGRPRKNGGNYEKIRATKKMLDVLTSFYNNPQFRVNDREGKSTYRTQKAGIWQGCPLSVYLFICLMTVMFHDIHNDLENKLRPNHLDHFIW